MNKNEIISKLQIPGQYMDEYLEALDGLSRSELMEFAHEVNTPIRSDYSNLDIKKAIVNAFMLPRHWSAYATIDDIETAIERRSEE